MCSKNKALFMEEQTYLELRFLSAMLGSKIVSAADTF